MAKVKDNYDVVVVGGGIGGLTCGALLAKNKRRVLVIEQGARPGGCCSSFELHGYTFDRGLRYLTGCEYGGPIYGVLEELEMRHAVDFIEMKPSIRVVGNGYDFRLNSGEGLEDKLVGLFPMETSAIRRFMSDCRGVAADMQDVFRQCPDLMSIWRKIALAVASLLGRSGMARYGKRSWRQVVEGFFKDPKLVAITLSVFPYLDTGVMATLPMMLLGSKEDFYYPKGGAQALAGVLADGLRRYGGQLVLKTLVDRILVEDGRAVGIALSNGRRVKAGSVVSGVDARHTFLKLVGGEHLGSKFARKLNEARLSDSAFVISLGVSMNLKAIGFDGANIIYNPSDDVDELFSSDPSKCTVSINMHSNIEPWQVPDSNTAVQLTVMLPYDAADDWGVEGDGIADKVIESAGRVIPGLEGHIAGRHIISPRTWEESTLNSRGASSGWYPAPKSRTRSQKTPIKNLYQAGHWTFLGGGLPAVVASGRNAARLVLSGK